MRAGPLNRSKGAGSKVGCVLDIDFRKVDVADGETFMERSAYGHICTVHGTVWNLNGQVFDGVAARVDPPAVALFDFVSTDKFSFATRFKGDNLILPVHQMLFDNLKAPINGYSTGLNNNTRQLVFTIGAGAYPATTAQIMTVETIADDRWVDLESYYDGSQAAAGMSISIGGDSRPIVVAANGDITGDITNDQNPNIGDRASSGTYTFDGLMTLMRVYKADQYAARILQRAINSRRN